MMKSLRNHLPPPKKNAAKLTCYGLQINLLCSVLCTMGERKKAQKEEKPFPILLLSVPEARQGIIFVFSVSAQESNYIASFPLIKKYLMSKTNIEILLELSMLCLRCF